MSEKRKGEVVKKHWVRKTEFSFFVNKKTGNLCVINIWTGKSGIELSDTIAKDLYLWLKKYLAFKKKTPRAVQIRETRIKARSVLSDIESMMGE